jgi:hypothetical protein
MAAMQAAVRASTQQLPKDLRLNSRQYIETTLAVGSNVIRHALRRLPQGWAIVDLVGGDWCFAREAWSADTITLLSTGIRTIKLEIW